MGETAIPTAQSSAAAPSSAPEDDDSEDCEVQYVYEN